MSNDQFREMKSKRLPSYSVYCVHHQPPTVIAVIANNTDTTTTTTTTTTTYHHHLRLGLLAGTVKENKKTTKWQVLCRYAGMVEEKEEIAWLLRENTNAGERR